MESKGSIRPSRPLRGTHLGGSGRRGGWLTCCRKTDGKQGQRHEVLGGRSENDRLRRTLPPSLAPSADSGRDSRQVGGAFKEGQELDRVQKHVSFSILPSWNP